MNNKLVKAANAKRRSARHVNMLLKNTLPFHVIRWGVDTSEGIGPRCRHYIYFHLPIFHVRDRAHQVGVDSPNAIDMEDEIDPKCALEE